MLLQGEDGSGAGITSTGGGGFEFGVDPNDDPELALALRVSMEEQRARQQAEGGEKKLLPSKWPCLLLKWIDFECYINFLRW